MDKVYNDFNKCVFKKVWINFYTFIGVGGRKKMEAYLKGYPDDYQELAFCLQKICKKIWLYRRESVYFCSFIEEAEEVYLKTPKWKQMDLILFDIGCYFYSLQRAYNYKSYGEGEVFLQDCLDTLYIYVGKDLVGWTRERDTYDMRSKDFYTPLEVQLDLGDNKSVSYQLESAEELLVHETTPRQKQLGCGRSYNYYRYCLQHPIPPPLFPIDRPKEDLTCYEKDLPDKKESLPDCSNKVALYPGKIYNFYRYRHNNPYQVYNQWYATDNGLDEILTCADKGLKRKNRPPKLDFSKKAKGPDRKEPTLNPLAAKMKFFNFPATPDASDSDVCQLPVTSPKMINE